MYRFVNLYNNLNQEYLTIFYTFFTWVYNNKFDGLYLIVREHIKTTLLVITDSHHTSHCSCLHSHLQLYLHRRLCRSYVLLFKFVLWFKCCAFNEAPKLKPNHMARLPCTLCYHFLRHWIVIVCLWLIYFHYSTTVWRTNERIKSS